MSEFDSTLCGLTSFSCIPQPGTGVKLDPLREVIMNRLAYRNFGNRQVLVGNFSTDVGGDRSGVRWFELRKTGASWTLFQEGTYGSGTLNRWMGAIAMDKSGNIALGYNVANSSTYPGIRYAGRLSTDPLGGLPQGEHTIVSGSASNGSNRYGDYSAMSIDPADDCTFWFTGEWNAGSSWSTRIAKFKFDQCGSTPPSGRKTYVPLVKKQEAQRGTVAGRVTNATNNAAIPGAQVCVLSTNQCATTNSQGNYSIGQVPTGNQNVRATANGFTQLTETGNVPANSTLTLNFSLSPTLAAGEIRVVLTWGQNPTDLDSHLWLPPSNAYHVYYNARGSCTSSPWACLDVDDITSYGPETITIKQRYNGTYIYAVYNYSNSPSINSSQGVVRVYGQSGLVATFNVPASGSGRWWYVFDLNGSNGAITPHNVVQANSPAPYAPPIEAQEK